ncbi:MAG: hypothetical protein U9R68_00465 [Planctomycetota bacterium]|nr:hypothetical protein [Planctomycetota bacterium]
MGWLKRLLGRREPRDLHAMVLDRKGAWNRYDAARTTDDNSRHWIHADNLSADAANSPEVRRLLRNRTRYEVANNSYARGIVDTLANDLIGTGPLGLTWHAMCHGRPRPAVRHGAEVLPAGQASRATQRWPTITARFPFDSAAPRSGQALDSPASGG